MINFIRSYKKVIKYSLFILLLSFCTANVIAQTTLSTTGVATPTVTPTAPSTAWLTVIITAAGMAFYYVWNKYLRPVCVIFLDKMEDKAQEFIKYKWGVDAGKRARSVMENLETALLDVIDNVLAKRMASQQLTKFIVQKRGIYNILEKCRQSEIADQHSDGIILINDLEVQLSKMPDMLITPAQAIEILTKLEVHMKAENKMVLLQEISELKERVNGLSI